MSAAVASMHAESSSLRPPQRLHERRIVRLWSEALREEQANRYFAMHDTQFEGVAGEAGRSAWSQARHIWDGIPIGKRVDLPSWAKFALVLGFLRSGATVKKGGHRPMLRVELSIKQIAQRLRLGVSTVKQVIRWLGCGPIKYKGEVVAEGLRYLHRSRRIGRGYLLGELRSVYRTSEMVLTLAGRRLLALGPVDGGEWGAHSDDGAGEQTFEELRQIRRRENKKKWAQRRASKRAAVKAQRQADEAQRQAGIDAVRRTVVEMAQEGRPHPFDKTETKAWATAAREKETQAAQRAAEAETLAAEEARSNQERRAALAGIFRSLEATPEQPSRRKRQT